MKEVIHSTLKTVSFNSSKKKKNVKSFFACVERFKVTLRNMTVPSMYDLEKQFMLLKMLPATYFTSVKCNVVQKVWFKSLYCLHRLYFHYNMWFFFFFFFVVSLPACLYCGCISIIIWYMLYLLLETLLHFPNKINRILMSFIKWMHGRIHYLVEKLNIFYIIWH